MGFKFGEGPSFMDQPVVSIILTTFNSEDTVFDVLSAIARQDMSLKSIELIVVDGGSKDRTLEIVNEFLRKYGAFFYGVKVIVHDKNYGLSRARNDGIKTSSGIYILILDDDIIMNSSTLRILLEFLKKSPRNVAAVMPLCVKHPEGTLDRWYRIINEGRISHASSVTNCVLIRREVFEEIGFYDETLGLPFTMGEEIELAARAKNKGYRVLIVGFEKVLHVDDKKWREKKSIATYAESKEEGIRWLLGVLRRFLNAAKSIKNPRYRYSYKRYVASLPLLDKIKWYAYATVMLFIMILFFCLSTILGVLIPVTQPLASILIVMCFTLYMDVLRENWNSKAIHISLAYSALALMWRMLRSIMLLIPCRYKI